MSYSKLVHRMKHRTSILSAAPIAWIAILLLSTPATAGILSAERMTYQGRLLDNGAPLTGVVQMEFELWTEASGGTMVASQSFPAVPVSDGLFQVELTFGNEAYEDGLWLDVIADGITLSPRQRVTAVPLALHALNGGGESPWEVSGGVLAYGGPVSIATNAEDGLVVTGDINGVRAQANGSAVFGTSANGSGIQGVATGGSAENSGVYGTSFSEFGAGVRATNTHPTGTALRAEGFVGVIARADAIGVDGRGDDLGVYGESPGTAIFGAATDASAFAGYFVGPDGSSNYFERETGIGTTDPQAMLHIEGLGGDSNPNLALRVSVNDDDKLVVGNLGTSINQPVFLDGTLTLTTFAPGGAVDVCRTGSAGSLGQLAACSSSGRYKTDVVSLGSATDLVEQLRPVTFRWTESGEEDFGLVAEEVAAIEPRLATFNADGQIEGVKYRQLSTLLIRALQEQRQDIDRLHETVQSLNQQLEQRVDLVERNRALTSRVERLEALLIGERSVAGELDRGGSIRQ